MYQEAGPAWCRFQLIAKYTDPYTKIKGEQVVSSLDFSTIDNYDDQFTVTEYPTYYQIDITLAEDDIVFDKGYYYIYDTASDYDYYIESNYYDYQNINDNRVISFSVDKPTIESYRIEFGLSSSLNYYNYKILDTIEYK